VRRWKNGGWCASQSSWTNFLKRSCDRLSAMEHHAWELIWSRSSRLRHSAEERVLTSQVTFMNDAVLHPALCREPPCLCCVWQADATHIARGERGGREPA
jgi:hypothetical protein